jgi:hypothetical protein
MVTVAVLDLLLVVLILVGVVVLLLLGVVLVAVLMLLLVLVAVVAATVTVALLVSALRLLQQQWFVACLLQVVLTLIVPSPVSPAVTVLPAPATSQQATATLPLSCL